jgi:hypothetical protein
MHENPAYAFLIAFSLAWIAHKSLGICERPGCGSGTLRLRRKIPPNLELPSGNYRIDGWHLRNALTTLETVAASHVDSIFSL